MDTSQATEIPADHSSDSPPPGRVTDADRARMAAWGEWKRQSHEDARERHLALSDTQRLVVSAMMTMEDADLPGWRFREDDQPWLLHERAKELGLYRG